MQPRLTAISVQVCRWQLVDSASQICPRAGAVPESTPIGCPKKGPQDCLHLGYVAHLAAGVASKSVKLQRPARATVCSHSARGRDRQCRTYLNKYVPGKVVTSAHLLDITDALHRGRSRGLSRPRLVQSSDGVANLRQRDNGTVRSSGNVGVAAFTR